MPVGFTAGKAVLENLNSEDIYQAQYNLVAQCWAGTEIKNAKFRIPSNSFIRMLISSIIWHESSSIGIQLS